MTTRLQCQAPSCDTIIEGASEAIAIALFNSHQLRHATRQPPDATSKQKAPKVERPSISQDIPEEEWNNFTRRWSLFKKCTELQPAEVTAQLFQCCDETLGNHLLKENPAVIDGTEKELFDAIKRLAVIPVAISVRRADLLQMKQAYGETIRSFYAKVKGKAATCQYNIKCRCNPAVNIDFTDVIVRDVVVAGLADVDIRKETLGWTELDTASITDVIAYIEGKEMARSALTGSTSAAGISGFRKQKAERNPAPCPLQDLKKTDKCPECSRQFKLFTESIRGWNTRPHRLCLDCWRKTRPRLKPKSKTADLEGRRSMNTPQEAETGGFIMKVGTLGMTTPSDNTSYTCSNDRHIRGFRRSVELNHHIFTSNGWVTAKSLTHPTVRLRMTTRKEDYDAFGAAFPHIAPLYLQVITDTGAQSCLWSRAEFDNSGLHTSDLIPVTYGMIAANSTQINIDGAILARLEGRSSNGEYLECAVMVYISPDANGFYLSREAMAQLGIISKNFPQVGAALNGIVSLNEPHPASSVPGDTSQQKKSLHEDKCLAGTNRICDCPARQLPPSPPAALPFACVPENNDRMKNWLVERYASSTFNTCPHQLLPGMDGPPIKILVNPNATPVAAYTPATVPIHWRDQVEKDLLRDEAIGVIERVPLGEPMTWCHRMVITRKHDGGPRRTVDLSPLNKHCSRETHAMRPPFQLARSVPPHSWKTVTDAWNGYHSVPIQREDRHLTTFITPIGRFRYIRAPQGFLSSGDGYNRRFDQIVADFVRKERCVDDTLHYDQDLSAHWWRTIEFLELVGKAGVVLSPEKFQFAQRTVDFAGFRISDTTVEPLPKYVDAIRNFPTPSSLTDMRSWFGLVNQVSHYAQLRDIMSPFKPLLSPSTRFLWTDDLDHAFNASKDRIVAAIKEGVEIFDVNKRTCLRPDWSKTGIGYYLSQKHCTCSTQSPGCCENGWRITLAGSRFLSSAEQRYAPVEGEMLAVAWGLEQTKYFTQGCDSLLVVTDHKPLIKLLGDRTLDEITNTRLFRIKQRTLLWRFDIEHQPGKSNFVADAASRHPSMTISRYAESVSVGLHTSLDEEETSMIAAIRNDVDKFVVITWRRVQEATRQDTSMMQLISTVENGFCQDRGNLLPSLIPYWEYRNNLFVSDGVVLYKDRVVIPPDLRCEVLDILHSAHQGVSAMTARAQATVFWPGITQEIQERRDRCMSCNRNAPSNARMPPINPHIPGTPFEAVFADYFEFHGWQYLVMGDRLSGWTEVYRTRTGTAESGAKGLCMCIRRLIATFGVPEELSSDGGPQFTAGETRDFLHRWGIHHRVSSAYHPQSNGRAELAVKATKRLLENNVGPNGELNIDSFTRAMLTLRNTPDVDCKLSPAQILFGRQLRDAMPSINESEQKFSSTQFHPTWRDAWAAKENALRVRYARTFEALHDHSRPLTPLRHGDRVFIQNQEGNHPKKWDRSGTVLECRANDQYVVKVDGTGRLTLRNRKYLRKFEPHLVDINVPVAMPQFNDSNPPFQHTNKNTVEADTARQLDTADIPAVPVSHLPSTGPVPPSCQTDTPGAVPPSSSSSPPAGVDCERPPTRRSTRDRKPKLMYDPDSGSYVPPSS